MQRSAVDMLPEEIRKELEQKLFKSGFSNYVGWAEWLKENGYEISKSSVHRWGQNFEARLQALKIATDQAKAISAASEDDAGAMNDALIRLVQTKTFELLVELESDDKQLPKIGRMVAELARSAVQQKKWSLDLEKQVRERALKDVEEAAKRQGNGMLSAEQIKSLREQIL